MKLDGFTASEGFVRQWKYKHNIDLPRKPRVDRGRYELEQWMFLFSYFKTYNGIQFAENERIYINLMQKEENLIRITVFVCISFSGIS